MTENTEGSNGQGEVVPAGDGSIGDGGTGEGEQVAAVENGAPAQDGGQQARQPTAGESFMAITKSLIIRAIIIYFITSFFRRPQQPSGPQDGPEGQVDPSGRIPAMNLFQDGAYLDLYVYKSESDVFTEFEDPEALVWFKEDIRYGDWTGGPNGDGTYTHFVSFTTSERLRNNGSMYVHVYFVKSGFSPNPDAGDSLYNKKYTLYSTQRLNKYKRRHYRKTSNLITGETKLTEEEIRKAETMKVETVSHWHPNMTINIVHDFTQWTRGAVPPPLDEYVEFTAVGDKYKPITFLNTYWNLIKDYQAINSTSKTLDFHLTFQPLSLFKWQLYAAQAMKSWYECPYLLQECHELRQGAASLNIGQIMQLPETECPAFELLDFSVDR